MAKEFTTVSKACPHCGGFGYTSIPKISWVVAVNLEEYNTTVDLTVTELFQIHKFVSEKKFKCEICRKTFTLADAMYTPNEHTRVFRKLFEEE